jgi:hypothetical protein
MTKTRHAAEVRPELGYKIINQELLIFHADIKTVEVPISVRVQYPSLSPQFDTSYPQNPSQGNIEKERDTP